MLLDEYVRALFVFIVNRSSSCVFLTFVIDSGRRVECGVFGRTSALGGTGGIGVGCGIVGCELR